MVGGLRFRGYSNSCQAGKICKQKTVKREGSVRERQVLDIGNITKLPNKSNRKNLAHPDYFEETNFLRLNLVICKNYLSYCFCYYLLHFLL